MSLNFRPNRSKLQPLVLGLSTKIFKVWIEGTDIGIPNAKVFVNNENYERTQITNRDGIVWFLDVPPSVHYFNVDIKADGYKDLNFRIDVPSGEWYAPPFYLIPSIPVVPSRIEVINTITPFQGFFVDSKVFSPGYRLYYKSPTGQVPLFLFQDFYAVGDGQQVLDQIKSAGFRHVMIMHTRGGDGYNQANQPYGKDQLIPPANQSDEQWREMIDFIIYNGMLPYYCIMGEGQEGYHLIKDTYKTQIDTLRVGYDRTQYGPCIVVFDGVWPDNWSVDQMKFMIPYMRDIMGNQGYLGFMFGNGPAGRPYMWVEDEGDYHKDWMDGLDIVQTTDGVQEATCPSSANKAGYMIRNPNYFGICRPQWDMPFIFHDNSRGERAYCVIEWATYQTVRDPMQVWKPIVEANRQEMLQLGYKGNG